MLSNEVADRKYKNHHYLISRPDSGWGWHQNRVDKDLHDRGHDWMNWSGAHTNLPENRKTKYGFNQIVFWLWDTVYRTAIQQPSHQTTEKQEKQWRGRAYPEPADFRGKLPYNSSHSHYKQVNRKKWIPLRMEMCHCDTSPKKREQGRNLKL